MSFSRTILFGGVIALTVSLLAPQSVFAARIFSSGCELQGNSGGSMTNNLEWERSSWNGGLTEVSTSVKRSGLSSCRVSAPASAGGARIVQQVRASLDQETFYARFYLNIAQMPAHSAQIFGFTDGGAYTAGSLLLAPDGTLSLLDEDEDELGAASVPLNTNTWYRIEIGANFLGDIVGGGSDNHHIAVRVDGVDVIKVYHDESDFHEWDTVMLGLCFRPNFCSGPSNITTGDLYFDDIAFNDATGSYQNSWPGEGSIIHLQPNVEGDSPGDNNCTSGAWDSTDEKTPDGVYCNLDGGSLTVGLEGPGSAGADSRDSIAFVQVGVREAAAGSGTTQWRLRVKSESGGTWVQSPSIVTHNDTTYRTNGDDVPRNYKVTSYVDPDTGCPWTQYGGNSLDEAQIGLTTSVAAPDTRIDMIWALVEFNTQFKKPCLAQTGGNPPNAITTALSKTATYAQTKLGGFWAPLIATDKFCFWNSNNCTTDWHPEAKCRLEVDRQVVRKDLFFNEDDDFFITGTTNEYNISTNLCDGMLSTASKNAGWVSTGYDYTGRYSSGSLKPPRICHFMRLACDGVNVGVSSATGMTTGPLVYPVVDFTTSTNECSDGVDNADSDSDADYPTDLQCSSWADTDENA